MPSNQKRFKSLTKKLVEDAVGSTDRWVDQLLERAGKEDDTSVARLLDSKLESLISTALGLRIRYSSGGKAVYEVDPFDRAKESKLTGVFEALRGPLVSYAQKWAKKHITKEYLDNLVIPLEKEIKQKVTDNFRYQLEEAAREPIKSFVQQYKKLIAEELAKELTSKQKDIEELIRITLED